MRLYSCVQHREFSISVEDVKNCSAVSGGTLDAGAGQKEVFYYITYPADGIVYPTTQPTTAVFICIHVIYDVMYGVTLK